MYKEKYEQYRKYVNFIKKYRKASNAATGSEVDSNANVETKNITTCSGELVKRIKIGTNRLLMIDKLTEMYGEDLAEEYIRQIEQHEKYKHDETSIMPYTYGANEVVNVKYNGHIYTVSFERLYELCQEEETCLDKTKGVWGKYPKNMYVEDREGFIAVTRLIRKKRHRDLVRVNTENNNDIIVTDNHPMIVSEDIDNTVSAINSLGRMQFITTPSIEFGHLTSIVVPSELLDGKNNDKIIDLDKELGYFIGYFIAYGHFIDNVNIPPIKCNRYKCYNNAICLTGLSEEILTRLCKVLNKLGANYTIEFNSTHSNYHLLCFDNIVTNLIFDKFKISTDTTKRTLPQNIFEYTKDFAEGILEGTVVTNGLNSNMATSSRTAQLQIAQISRVLEKTENISNWQYINRIDMVTNNARDWLNDSSVENEYIYDITTESHTFVCNGIWVHNCVSITMYPFITNGLSTIGGISSAPTNLTAFCGSFINLVFAVAAQFAGAVSTPEFLPYMDYFIRKDYGEDYINHLDDIVTPVIAKRQRTLKQLIEDYFQQVVYSLNQPAAARDYQSVFWNIAYFDKPYFDGLFQDFVFPDGTEMNWETTNWLQKNFMRWFNAERLRTPLTFPVETVNLLDDGKEYVDKEWADFVAEMYAEKHSFFTYRSDSVDSLSSCCFDGSQKCLIRLGNTKCICLDSFRALYHRLASNVRNNLEIFYEGKWVKGKMIALPCRNMYKIITSNKKIVIATDNHIFPTAQGDKTVTDLTTNDYLKFNSKVLKGCETKTEDYKDGYELGHKQKYSEPSKLYIGSWLLSKSETFRKGVLDGLSTEVPPEVTTNTVIETRCREVLGIVEAIVTSLGMSSTITLIPPKTDSDTGNCTDVYEITWGKCEYYKIVSIEPYTTSDGEVYCFEMDNKDEPYFTLPNGIITHNCRLKNEITENTFSFTLGAGGISTGSKGVITTNINRLVQNAVREGRDISDKVREETLKNHKYLTAFNEIIKDSLKSNMLSIYNAGFIDMNKQYLTQGINGFVEGAEFLGIDISPNEKYFEYGEKILKPIYEENKKARTKELMFNTEYVPKMSGDRVA